MQISKVSLGFTKMKINKKTYEVLQDNFRMNTFGKIHQIVSK